MPDGVFVAAVLLIVSPVVGAIGLSHPALYRAWTAPRAEHLAMVGAHRRAWAMANAGFTVATVGTAAGLAVLAGAVDADAGRRAVLAAAVVVYAIGGALWCAVLAIRNGTTPALADMVAAGTPTEPGESLLGAAIGGLYSAFLLATGVAEVALGLALAPGGGAGAAVALLATLIAALAVARYLTSGDVIPAVMYFPTLLVGIALLLGS